MSVPSQVTSFTIDDWANVYKKLSANGQKEFLNAVNGIISSQKGNHSGQAKKRPLTDVYENENENGNDSKIDVKDAEPSSKRSKISSNESKAAKSKMQCHLSDNEIDQLCLKLGQEAKKDGIVKTVVGGIIFNSNKECLVLQRASDEFMGGIYEIASGTMETTDKNMIQCLKREVKEECGLIVNNIISFIDKFDYKSNSGKNTRQFTFLINVEKFDKIEISEEHQNYSWIKECDMFEKENKENEYNNVVSKITPQVRDLIRKAYKMINGNNNNNNNNNNDFKCVEKEKGASNENEELQDIDVEQDAAPVSKDKTKTKN